MVYVIIALVIAVLGAAIYLLSFGKKAGSAAVSADVAEETVDILRKQDKAAAEAKVEPVTDALRKGKF